MKRFFIFTIFLVILIFITIILIYIYNVSNTEINDELPRITLPKNKILEINNRFEPFYGINNSEQIKLILEQSMKNFTENCEDVYAKLKIPKIKYITEPNIVTLKFDKYFNGDSREQEYYIELNNILENITSDKSYNVNFKYTTSPTEPEDNISLIYEIDIVEFDGTEENLNTILQIHEAELDDQKKVEKHPEKVSIELKEDSVSKNGATIIITDNNEVIYNWNDIYFIEQKVGNNWKKVEMIENMSAQIQIDYNVDPNNQITFDIDWTPSYGELPNGIYRIVKPVGGDVEFRSNEFTIEE